MPGLYNAVSRCNVIHSYANEFIESENLRKDLPVLLSCYAEDVTRLVEREVKTIEGLIRCVCRGPCHHCCRTHGWDALWMFARLINRQAYPAARFIELEPDSYYTFKRKIDDMKDLTLRKYERNIMLQQLNTILEQKVHMDIDAISRGSSAEARAWLSGAPGGQKSAIRRETMVQVLQLMRRRHRHRDLRGLSRAVRAQARQAAQNGDNVSTAGAVTAHAAAAQRRTWQGEVTSPRRKSRSKTLNHPLMHAEEPHPSSYGTAGPDTGGDTADIAAVIEDGAAMSSTTPGYGDRNQH